MGNISFSLYVSLGYISAITIAEIGDSRAVRAIKWQEEVQPSWIDNHNFWMSLVESAPPMCYIHKNAQSCFISQVY